VPASLPEREKEEPAPVPPVALVDVLPRLTFNELSATFSWARNELSAGRSLRSRPPAADEAPVSDASTPPVPFNSARIFNHPCVPLETPTSSEVGVELRVVCCKPPEDVVPPTKDDAAASVPGWLTPAAGAVTSGAAGASGTNGTAAPPLAETDAAIAPTPCAAGDAAVLCGVTAAAALPAGRVATAAEAPFVTGALCVAGTTELVDVATVPTFSALAEGFASTVGATGTGTCV
jgi:hypothetical protein